MKNDFCPNIISTHLNKNYTFEILDSIDTTMNYIKKYIPIKKYKHIVIAREQVKGRGQNGKLFSSPKDKGLYFSLLLKPEGTIDSIFKITIMMSVAIFSALKKLYNIEVKLKWVNDIFLNDLKIGGILCESSLASDNKEFEYLIVGVGINVRKQTFSSEINNIASSLENLVNMSINKNELLVEIINNFDSYFLEKEDYMCYYRKENYTIGKNVIFSENNKNYFAKAIDISEQGYLIVETDFGQKIVQSSANIKIMNEF